MNTQRLLTGLQPSGDLHLGNFFGALQPFVNFLDTHPEYESYLMVADYHALTSLKDGEALRANIYNLVRTYLAAGVDPKKVVLFRQSDNLHHMELGWIFNCLVTVPFLMQAHSYKDKVAKGLDANAGLFTYPMLMAADIALYDTEIVPVGEDQRQHLEYTREAITKFNNAYGDTLREPKEYILPQVGIVPGLDGQKMSKSYGNTIPLFAPAADIKKAVMRIVTDSNGDFPHHVYAIHRLIKTESELTPIYKNSSGRYGEIKQQLAQDLIEYLAPMQARYAAITDAEIHAVLSQGAEKAMAVSIRTMEKVRQKIGITI